MTHIDLELMDNMKRVFDEARRKDLKEPSKTFQILKRGRFKNFISSDGGPVKAKIKQPKEVKKINLSQYFEPGKLVASMTSEEKSQAKALLNKMLKGVRNN